MCTTFGWNDGELLNLGTPRVIRSQITLNEVRLPRLERSQAKHMTPHDGEVEIFIEGRRYRGLWQVEAGAMTVRLGALSKTTTLRGMENYPSTLARWLVVQLIPVLAAGKIAT